MTTLVVPEPAVAGPAPLLEAELDLLDHVTKPFQFAELLARVRLRLREGLQAGPAAEGTVLGCGDLTLDLLTRHVSGPGVDVDLTAREFGLLEVFLHNPRQVLSRQQLLGHVWGVDFDTSSNVVDVCIRSLRAKIGADRIETVRGAGYRFRA